MGGGGYFQFFTKNRPHKRQKRAILHTSQANGGAQAPPAPPGYATLGSLAYYLTLNVDIIEVFVLAKPSWQIL